MPVAVVGFDVGSLTSYIGVAKGGGIEVITNEYSDRNTPTCVSFGISRSIGTAAHQQAITNLKNTVTNFSRLLGKSFNDPIVDVERKFMFCDVVEGPDGKAAFKVIHDSKEMILLPEQLVAMQFGKLAHLAETVLSTKVVDIVLNVPTYFTNSERRGMMDAARIAGLNCVRLVNDTTAVGIAYGIYNKDLPGPEEPSRNVAFVNLGNSSLQASIITFNSGKMKVVSTTCNPYIGGRDFDMCIFNHMVNEFKDKYKLDVLRSPRACARLLQSCEKLKKVMSTNATDIPLNIECLMEDKDVSSRMKRSYFEELCKPLLDSIRKALEEVLNQAKIQPSDLFCVELTGGCTRIPAVKQIILEVFKQEGRITLNADEAVARGCALQAAICSPSFKVKEFIVIDACSHSISLQWEPVDISLTVGLQEEQGISKGSYEEVYPKMSSIPASRQLTFLRQSDFTLRAWYSTPSELHINNPDIGTYRITGVKNDNPGDVCKVRVKIRVNSSGIFTIPQASIAEIVEKEVEVPIEADKPSDKPIKHSNSDESPEGDKGVEPVAAGEPAINDVLMEPISTDKQNKKQMVKKLVTRYRDIPVESNILQLSPSQLMELAELEAKMIQKDKLEKERHDLKNSLEECVYEYRNKVDGALSNFLLTSERDSFTEQLSLTEEWIYREGENAGRSELSKRVNALKTTADRYLKRMYEAERIPNAIEAFKHSCMVVKRIIDSHAEGETTWDHLTKEDVGKLEKWLNEKHRWLDTQLRIISTQQKTDDPKVTSDQILIEKGALESLCSPIMSKPKPTPPPEKTDTLNSPNSQSQHKGAPDLAQNASNNQLNGVNEIQKSCASQEMEID